MSAFLSRKAAFVACLSAGWLLTSSFGVCAAEIVDDPRHIAELAAYANQTSNSFCWELHRFHQQQPDYPIVYRDAKEIWNLSAQLRDQLQLGPSNTPEIGQQVARMNALYGEIEKLTAKWGDGVRPAPLPGENVERRVVVRPGPGVNVPYLGFRISAPRVGIAEEVIVPAAPRVHHPNSRGSRRSLERELFAVKTSLSYLTEDVGPVQVVNQLPVAPPAEAIPPRPEIPVTPTAIPAPIQPELPATQPPAFRPTKSGPELGPVLKVSPRPVPMPK